MERKWQREAWMAQSDQLYNLSDSHFNPLQELGFGSFGPRLNGLGAFSRNITWSLSWSSSCAELIQSTVRLRALHKCWEVPLVPSCTIRLPQGMSREETHRGRGIQLLHVQSQFSISVNVLGLATLGPVSLLRSSFRSGPGAAVPLGASEAGGRVPRRVPGALPV